jgi:exopolyphosphatase / guanosine-5'-triphosphate,3'-diphosphate pyrophosphatase
VIARCAAGHPLVIRNRPLDPEGHPFPTLYWLTCPEAVRRVSRLESQGWIRRLEQEAELDPDVRAALERAHRGYAAERGRLVAGAEAWGGVGGTARGLKCLHAHYAHHLAGGRDPVGAWVHRRLRHEPLHYEKPDRRVAAIDLGTNSVRLLVLRRVLGDGPPEGSYEELSRDTTITRLGQGVDATGRLDPEALRRTLSVVGRYARRARALGAERVRLSATSAVRDASNRDELGAAVERLTGEPMRVLSGEEEAATSFLGATRGLAAPAPFLVLDIGGGSTELILGTEAPQASVSTQMGSVRLTERFVRTDPPSTAELEAVEAAVARVLEEAQGRVPVRQAGTLVAVAGTVTTVQSIALGQAEYDPEAIHGSTLSRADARRVYRLLADMTTAERREIPVMPRGREDVIVAGAAILVAVLERFGFDRALISEHDILDGLAYRLLEEVGA